MKQYKDILYIKDQLGKIREWYLTYNDSTYIKNYGILNGETIFSITNVTDGKNIGKSNETSISQQVLKECESEYKRQIKLGYKSLQSLQSLNHQYIAPNSDIYSFLNSTLSSSKTDENNYLKPMKAMQRGDIKFPAICQPKINGVRATGKTIDLQDDLFGNKSNFQFKSKEGMIYDINHLHNLGCKFTELNKDIILDGEIYISSEHVTTIGGAARNPVNSKFKDLAYIIFDLSIPSVSQIERLNMIEELAYILNSDYVFTPSIDEFLKWNKENRLKSAIFICPYVIVNSKEEILEWTNKFIEFGFEGAIVRDMNAEYKFGSRAKTMVKYKKFDDAEFKILDIIAGEKDGKSIFICKNDINDLTFRVDGIREYLHTKYIINKQDYIGKLATVKFYERTINELPFHTTLIGIRDYE